MINYNNKKFRLISNSQQGELSPDFVFHYFQEGNILRCNYSGGKIIAGQLLGVIRSDGSIKISYHQLNVDNQLRSGNCYSTPTVMTNGKIKLEEKWKWSDEKEWGYSTLEEL